MSKKAKPPKAVRRPVCLDMAQAVLRDERHWSIVDVADRAEAAVELARLVLKEHGEVESTCKRTCADCREHERSLA